MSVPRLCSIITVKEKRVTEVSTDRLQRRFRDGLPGLAPGTLLGARIAFQTLLVAPVPNPPPGAPRA